jgi:hypothetical protein
VVSQLAVAAGADHVDHVDIDREAVRLCARHLPYGYTVDELRTAESGLGPVTMHYCDGWAFVSQSGLRYDLVVVDLPDERTPPAQHNRLYRADRVATMRARLPTLSYRPRTIDAESLAASTVPPKQLRANANGVTVSRRPPRGPTRIARRPPAAPRD